MQRVAATADTADMLDRVAARWQKLFDANAAAFAELVDGARVGFVARADFAATNGRRLQGLAQAGSASIGAPMLAFESRRGRMTVERAHFDGFEHARVDLLFVAADEAIDELIEGADPLGAIKRALRRGSVMFYALKPKHELQDAGYEDFLDTLGLAFLGACR
jgi:hypothetical protein